MSLNFFVIRYKGKVLLAKQVDSTSASVNFSIRKDDIDEASYESLKEYDYALEYTFAHASFVYVNYVPLDRLKNSFLIYNDLVLQIESKTELCKYAKYHEKVDFSKKKQQEYSDEVLELFK